MKKLPKALSWDRPRPKRDGSEEHPPKTSGLAGKPAVHEALRAANDANAAARPPANEQWRSLHRSRAVGIVERHANLAAVGGALPIAIISVAGVTAINLRMLKRLSDHYGVPFEREKARMLLVGLTGGCMPSGLASATTSALAFVLPTAALFGVAVSAVAASVCTRGIGQIFVELFEEGVTWRDLPAN